MTINHVSSVTNATPQPGSGNVPEEFKFWDLLKQREQELIKRLLSLGYLDPKEDDDQNASLVVGDDRLFIKEIRFVDYDELEESNVRAKPLDKAWAEDELIPLFDAREIAQGGGPGMMYPPQVGRNPITGKFPIYVGHHRAWAQHKRKGKICVLVVTKPINKFGKQSSLSTIILAKTRSNPRMDSLQVVLKDASVLLDQLYDADPTFEGKNPLGKKIPRSSDTVFDFDDLMDWAYMETGNFINKSTRTKIYNQWTNGGPKSKLLNTADEANITQHLATLSLSPGLNKNGNRKEFLKHFDLATNSLVMVVSDNGFNLNGKCFKFIMEWMSNPEYRGELKDKNIKYLSIIGRIFDPPVSLKRIQNKRESFVANVYRATEVVETVTGIKLRLIAMPKELLNDKDKGFEWKLNSPSSNIIIRRKNTSM